MHPIPRSVRACSSSSVLSHVLDTLHRASSGVTRAIVMAMTLAFSWPYGLIFVGVMFWAFAPEFRIVSRSTEPMTSSQDAGSKRLIAVGQGLAGMAAFPIAALVRSASLPYPVLLFWTG